MSALWDVTVLDKGSDWVDLEVVFAHPDAGDFPEDSVFALALLTQKAYGFDDNYNYIATSPLGEAIPHDKSYQPFDLKAVVDQFIKKTTIYKAQNLPWDESAAHEKMDQLCIADGLSKDDAGWEDAWHDHWRDFWANIDNLPWAKYRVLVTDGQWIEHLSIGDSYDTAAYSEQGPWVGENLELEIEQMADASARKKVPGFIDSEIPPRETVMNHGMIRGLASSGGPLPENELQALLDEHASFLDTGGAGGRWERLHVSGIPMNIYMGAKAGEGTQLKLSMKLVEATCSLLKGKNMAYADLSGMIAEKVDWSGTTLDGSLLTDGFFTGANFEGASCKGVDFTGADLMNASFRGADLTNADFEIANCEGADFTGANLTGATFKGAELKGVKR